MNQQIRIEKLEISELPQVLAIEKDSFAAPWSELSFKYEILERPETFYFALKFGEKLAGYGGLWLIDDEAHIATFAIAGEFRRKGLGKLLLSHLLKFAADREVKWITLEVNQQNLPAVSLYKKLGWVETGRRKDYYGKNQDALIMWAGNLQGLIFQEKFVL